MGKLLLFYLLIIKSKVQSFSFKVSSFCVYFANQMANRNWVALFMVFSCLVGVLDASAGDADPLYR